MNGDAQEDMNSSVVEQRSLPDWFKRDYEGVPWIYPISLYYINAFVQFSRITNVVWYVIGFIGNIIAMKIWTLPRMKRINSSALYLVSISFCDIFYQMFHLVYYLKYFWGVSALGYTGVCEAYNILNMVPQYASQLLVLGFSTERFISIYQPFRGERFSRYQRAPRTITAIMVFAISISIPQGYFWKRGVFGMCEIRYDMFDNDLVMQFYTIWTYTTESIIFFIVPCATLIINVIVLWKTHKSINVQTMFNNLGMDEARIHRKDTACRPSTITLLCVSFFRIATQLPISIMFMLQNTYTSGHLTALSEVGKDPQWRRFLSFYAARITIETIGTSYHAMSFFVFYMSTKQFRKEFRQMCITIRKCALPRHRDCEMQFVDDCKPGIRSSFRAPFGSSARSTETSFH